MTRLPLQLSQASGVPFYRQVVDQIADLLRTGALPPGFQLPSVRELGVQLRVSLITTRRAYADLEAAGLIVSKHGQGTFVAEGAATASRLVMDVCSPAMTVPIGEGFFAPPLQSAPLTPRSEPLSVQDWECAA